MFLPKITFIHWTRARLTYSLTTTNLLWPFLSGSIIILYQETRMVLEENTNSSTRVIVWWFLPFHGLSSPNLLRLLHDSCKPQVGIAFCYYECILSLLMRLFKIYECQFTGQIYLCFVFVHSKSYHECTNRICSCLFDCGLWLVQWFAAVFRQSSGSSESDRFHDLKLVQSYNCRTRSCKFFVAWKVRRAVPN